MGPEAAKASANAAPAKPKATTPSPTSEPGTADLEAILSGEAAGDGGPEDVDEEDPEDGDDPEAEDLDEEDESEQGSEEPAEDGEPEEEEESEDEPAEDETSDEGEEPEAEEEADEDLADAQAKLSPEEKKKFNALFEKALAKKTRKNAELREQLGAAQAELKEEREKKVVTKVAPTAENPLAGVDTDEELDAKVAEMKHLRSWARRNPEGGVVKNAQGEEVEISKERAADMLEQAESVLEAAEGRRVFLRNRAKADMEAVKEYPWLKDKSAPATVVVETTLRKFPQLRELFPDVKIALADMLVGEAVRKQRANTATKPAEAAKKKVAPKAPATAAGGARAPKVSLSAKVSTGAAKQLHATGNDPGNATLRGLINL